ncbi:restriction endonuclease [Sinosporangium siamense]|uniref:Restriction endonuclease type IV Mrr domain-containing protein n=1 Tax=Sinosporangium siamense TaxID=1367973 RepID=A0A919V848_9ACTN|nr:restriction endonuclease [Sinosporangium siamense]GII93811.1 hypothetical protein Ssi02_40420 [Sinosporangium siamense]
MAKRRPATRRRRNRTSRGQISLSGLAVAIFLVVVIAALVEAFLDFLGDHWPWLTAVAVALAACAAGGLVVRARLVAARERQWMLDHAALERVDTLSGPEFERLTAALLRRDGFAQVTELGRAGDGGVDLTAVGPGGERLAFQCKRYAGKVGAPEVRNFLGALAFTWAGHTGVLITSGHLTGPAMEEARRADLVVLERDDLARWLSGAASLPSRAL